MLKRTASDKQKKVSSPLTIQSLVIRPQASSELASQQERPAKSAARRLKDRIFNRDVKDQKLVEAAPENTIQTPTLVVTSLNAPSHHQNDVINRLRRKLVSDKEESDKRLADLSEEHAREIRKLEGTHTNVVERLSELIKELTTHSAQNIALLQHEKDELAKDHENDNEDWKEEKKHTLKKWSKQVGDLSAKNAQLENESVARKNRIEELEQRNKELSTEPSLSVQPLQHTISILGKQIQDPQNECKVNKVKLAGQEDRINSEVENAVRKSVVAENYQQAIRLLQDKISILEESDVQNREIKLLMNQKHDKFKKGIEQQHQELAEASMSLIESLQENSERIDDIKKLIKMRDELIEGNNSIAAMRTPIQNAAEDNLVSIQAEQLLPKDKMIHIERQNVAKPSDTICALRKEVRDLRFSSKALTAKTKNCEDLKEKLSAERAEFYDLQLAMVQGTILMVKSNKTIQTHFSLWNEANVKEYGDLRPFQFMNDQIDHLTRENARLKAQAVQPPPPPPRSCTKKLKSKIDQLKEDLQLKTVKLESVVKEVVKKDKILKERREKISSQAADLRAIRKELDPVKKQLRKLQADSDKGSVEAQKRCTKEKEKALLICQESLSKYQQEESERQDEANELQEQVVNLTSRVDTLAANLNQAKSLWEKFRPFVEIGAHIRNRYLEKRKPRYEQNNSLIKLGNFAAHGSFPMEDALLYEPDLPVCPRLDFEHYEREYGIN
ncbi:hypothetical protein BJ875DRAFT_441280 [Amylocarpus encephaloides]|uniref:Uncharacterized protein n=1 Tax=Amylocarpus encephaloides TaxID=45428 RepID=A0A9P8C5P7_9HELO|nr:hypothetical protein BJ875DRAFT_441280 [Amylocarpus encephaloides]